jgi:nicotinate-nucleotide pyrophosphorylase (carboxylating)
MAPSALPLIMIEPLVRMALLEDLGRAGDLTTDAILPVGHRATTLLVARQTGVVAGLDLARLAFQLIDPAIEMRLERSDGAVLANGDVIATATGPARGILTAERVALNFLCRLSGIATATASGVAAVRDTKAKIVCTRKTTPGLRTIEKYSVRIGGGSNHRFGLDDAVLIKDNHFAVAGSVTEALKRKRPPRSTTTARLTTRPRGVVQNRLLRLNITAGITESRRPGGDQAHHDHRLSAGLVKLRLPRLGAFFLPHVMPLEFSTGSP